MSEAADPLTPLERAVIARLAAYARAAITRSDAATEAVSEAEERVRSAVRDEAKVESPSDPIRLWL